MHISGALADVVGSLKEKPTVVQFYSYCNKDPDVQK